jgi:hypothetical protein
MEESVTKNEILTSIASEREALEKLITKLSHEIMLEPGFEGNWSIKDMLAHISEWEQMMIKWTQELLRGETPDRPPPGSDWADLDTFNESLFQKNKDRSLEDVLAMFFDSYPETYQIIANLSEEDLLNPDQFAWRAGDPLWHMVAANTWWHYKEHRESIERWLADSKGLESD